MRPPEAQQMQRAYASAGESTERLEVAKVGTSTRARARLGLETQQTQQSYARDRASVRSERAARASMPMTG
jgi:hypothetical protein